MSTEIKIADSGEVAETAMIYKFEKGKSLKQLVQEMRAGEMTYPDEARELIVKAFIDYTLNTEMPTLAEFCSDTFLPPSTLKTWPDFIKALEIAKAKSEAHIFKQAIDKQMPIPIAIFALKQYGWKDKPEEVESKVAVQVNLAL